MKNLTWQNPEQLFVAQELINKVKSKCCGIKDIQKKLMKMEKFICNTCGYVYDPAVGDPDAGIAPGTPFESLPDDWVCPLCGVGKDDFEPYNE